MTALLEERPSTLMSAPCHGVADQTSPLATPRQEAKTGRLRQKLKAKDRSLKPEGLLRYAFRFSA